MKDGRIIRIALAGNPNCGKTTLYNVLTGSNQFVGNWPGVTVEKKEGYLKKHDNVIVTDLPGIYSLSPYTAEEVVARKYLVKERPEVILNIIDGTNLERNLYLTTQLAELGIPMVIAVNMMDVVRKNGDQIDFSELSRELGCKVLEISALKNEGTMEAAEAAIDTAIQAAGESMPLPMHTFSGPVEHAVAHIEEAILHELPLEKQRWYAVKIFERDEKVLAELAMPAEKMKHIEQDIKAAEAELDDDAEAIIISERYLYISHVIKCCFRRKHAIGLTPSDKIDQIVTSRWLGFPILALVMFLVYYFAMISIGQIATDWTNHCVFGEGFSLFGYWVPGIPVVISNLLNQMHCAEWLHSLIIDGVVAGVGSVLGFVPQLFVLFFLLAVLEACGYMSRIAFVLDKVFRKFGLSGKSFIPILVGTGCGVPGIMASRTIESERDRRMTVITTTFMPCSAKMPFIALIAGAIFGGSPWVATSAYFIGLASIIVSGMMLMKTRLFTGKPAPFVMELPPYHLPSFSNVMKSTWDRGWSFVKKAGTVILLFSVIVWGTTHIGFAGGTLRMLGDDELEYSFLAAIGNLIAWLFYPLGWGNWQSAVASLTGLVAKENIVSTLGVVYQNVGMNSIYGNVSSAFSKVSGMSFMLFNLLCAPCVAAMAAIHREMKKGGWTAFAIGYQCVYAYAIALMVYQFGSALTGDIHIIGFVAACGVLGTLIYMLVRK